MRQLFINFRNWFKLNKDKNSYDEIFSDISRLSQSKLSLQEIQLFLNVNVMDFNDTFFKKYYPDYYYLSESLNILALITYIDFIKKIKLNIRNIIFKRTLYPIVLLITSIGTLFIFRNHLLTLLSDYVDPILSSAVNAIYYVTLSSSVILFLIAFCIILIVNRKDYYLIAYSRIFNLRAFKLHETYHIKLITQLLIIAYEDGLSTSETFILMNSFKGETIISNIAYFVTSDLSEGLGINQSIENMRLSANFKKVLTYAIESDRYYDFLKSYNAQLDSQFEQEVKLLSRNLYIISYVYIAILVLLFYKIMSLPLSMIDQF